ncbi:MAG TPA: hypothetical protein VIM19_11645, partial [Actinomycetes bacterium]
MLNRDQLDARQVEDLTNLKAHHRRVSKVRSAASAAGRGMDPDLIGHRHRLGPEPLTSGLLARPAPRRPPQRLRRGLGQTVAARWLRGVPGVLSQPRFQLRHPTRQRRDQRIALSKQDEQL